MSGKVDYKGNDGEALQRKENSDPYTYQILDLLKINITEKNIGENIADIKCEEEIFKYSGEQYEKAKR